MFLGQRTFEGHRHAARSGEGDNELTWTVCVCGVRAREQTERARPSQRVWAAGRTRAGPMTPDPSCRSGRGDSQATKHFIKYQGGGEPFRKHIVKMREFSQRGTGGALSGRHFS